MEINRNYCENCLVTMAKMPDNFIDLTITGPPYDDMRTYDGYVFDFKEFKKIARELFRVTKPGGVIVWNVWDQIKNGSETGTSARQKLFFKAIGFNIHNTMIWQKNSSGCFGSKNRYEQNFEYIFVFSKGAPKTFNPIYDKPNVAKSGKTITVNHNIDKSGKARKRTIVTKPFGKRTNVWTYAPQKNSKHPAPFPEPLIRDHMISWSNEGDLVYDCFMGSGTTGAVAILNNRNWMGSEMSEKYCNDIIEPRIKAAYSKMGITTPHKTIILAENKKLYNAAKPKIPHLQPNQIVELAQECEDLYIKDTSGNLVDCPFNTTLGDGMLILEESVSEVFYSRFNVDETQLQQITGFDYVLTDYCSGTIPLFERPKGSQIKTLIDNEFLKHLEVHSIDQLGKNIQDVLSTWEYLTNLGITIVCHNPNIRNIDENGNKTVFSEMLMSILSTMSSFEQSLIQERQMEILEHKMEGIRIAKLNKVYKGRKPGSSENTLDFLGKDQNKKVLDYLEKGYKCKDAAKLAGVHCNTVTKIKKAKEMIAA